MKNIVICADGTGNTFGAQVSNVSRLVQLIDLDNPEQQVAFYDQGIGTDPRYINTVKAYRDRERVQRRALEILDPPFQAWWVPSRIVRGVGLAIGYGLRRNVRELYTALAQCYEDGDRIYLFGFSRGAFTVRVLAGLLFRCGLLPKDSTNFEDRYEHAYDLFTPHLQDFDAVERFKRDEKVRTPRVYFLGIWDTVKSYGGIWPQSLPHLRHNPIVDKVRHALALDEQRSWFLPTSWGGIDSDRPVDDPAAYRDQEVVEIWFRGVHSDVGGGNNNPTLNGIALNWLFQNAKRCGLPIRESDVLANIAAIAKPGKLSSHKIDSQVKRRIRDTDLLHSSVVIETGDRFNNPGVDLSRIDDLGVITKPPVAGVR